MKKTLTNLEKRAKLVWIIESVQTNISQSAQTDISHLQGRSLRYPRRDLLHVVHGGWDLLDHLGLEDTMRVLKMMMVTVTVTGMRLPLHRQPSSSEPPPCRYGSAGSPQTQTPEITNLRKGCSRRSFTSCLLFVSYNISNFYCKFVCLFSN